MPYLGLNVMAFICERDGFTHSKFHSEQRQLQTNLTNSHPPTIKPTKVMLDQCLTTGKGLQRAQGIDTYGIQKKKTLQTCHCIVITYFCCDYVASYPRFPSAGVGLYETKPDLAVRLYITLVLTVFNNVHDCYLLL